MYIKDPPTQWKISIGNNPANDKDINWKESEFEKKCNFLDSFVYVCGGLS